MNSKLVRLLTAQKPTVLHQQTCPKCGGKLVNLYRRGDQWKCRHCWDREEADHGQTNAY